MQTCKRRLLSNVPTSCVNTEAKNSLKYLIMYDFIQNIYNQQTQMIRLFKKKKINHSNLT